MRKINYFKLQLKRAFKHYPTVLLVTFIAILGVAVTVAALLHFYNSENNRRINIGIVGNLSKSRIETVVYALENMDGAITSVDFEEMSEEKAKEALQNNEIVGYISIPEKYFEDMAYGENSAAKYISAESNSDLGSVLANELAMLLSDMVTETQRGIYSAIDIAEDKGLKKGIYDKIDKLNFDYIKFVLNRQQTYNVEYLGVKDKLTYGAYYICGFFIFLLMIWGVACSTILHSKNTALSRMLYARGMKTYWQVGCEYAGYFIITFLTFLIIFTISGIFMSVSNSGIRELSGISMLFGVGFAIKLIPVMLMFTAMHFMVYEMFHSIISSVLVQFVVAVGLGYISGCFYPNTFFPEGVQSFASKLPSGAGFSYMGKLLTFEPLGGDFVLVLCYIALFLTASVVIRKYRIKGDM